MIEALPLGRAPAPRARVGRGGRARDVGAGAVLRAARRPLHRPHRRARHRGARVGAAQRGRRGTGPIVVHVLTQKGRGYAPALADDEKVLHDTGVFDPETGTPRSSSGPSYTGTFSDALVRLGDADDRVIAITAAMPGSTGLLPFADKFPDRFLDVGIAEQHAVTAAAGMAMIGLRPVCAIYSPFLTRAFDQVVYDVALHQQPVIFAVDRAGVTGPDGASAPRRARHGAAHQGPGHDGVRAVVGAGARGDAARRACRSPTGRRRCASLAPRLAVVESAPGRLGPAGPPGGGRVGDERGLLPRRRQDAGGVRGDRRVAGRDGVGRAVREAARRGHAARRRRAPARRHRRGRHPRRRRRHADPGRHRRASTRRGRARRCSSSALPSEFLPHGNPDQILADLGLDAAGILASTEAALARLTSPL